MERILAEHWHAVPAEEALTLLGSGAKGLDLFEVDHRQKSFGRNVLSEKEKESALKRFLLQFNQPLIYILLVATLITAFLGEWIDAAVIFGVVFVNALLGFIQEAKAIAALKALAKDLLAECTVLRAAEKQRIPVAEVVPGDIVLLEAGDKVPADMRLLESRDLEIDESILTGESLPVAKKNTLLPLKTLLADRKNMAYSSTLVTRGAGRGVVVSIGDRTEIGAISRMIQEAKMPETPLTKKIKAFTHWLLFVILAVAVLTFIIGLLRGEPWYQMFMASVALAVGVIPEGLPAALTITLAIGVARMARRRAIIRKLPAVETLGSTTVICSDKTGTLTQNQMTVQRILAGGVEYTVTGIGYDAAGEIRAQHAVGRAPHEKALRECLLAGALCNNSHIKEEEGRWAVSGDPTEAALLVSAKKGGIEAQLESGHYKRIDELPFESEHQYMVTLHRSPSGGETVAYLKGSVERVLERCSDALGADGQLFPLEKFGVESQAAELAAEGLRVLAFAQKKLPGTVTRLTHDEVKEGLTFIGLQAMLDPPRSEAITAVKACQSAGITVKMITGDHPLTAQAIARALNLLTEDDKQNGSKVITGRELEELSDSQLIVKAAEAAVFARVTPEQKLRLVEALQARRQVVAMTGDGVNDAPALRQADIGVAMGMAGTEVAKEAADMVLTDDNFASIEAAVEEGRGVFDNLKKFIVWTLPTNVGEGLVILAAILVGTTLPILPVQILWINMATALFLGLTLAFEPKEEGIMLRPPRDPQSALLDRTLIKRIALVSALLLWGCFTIFKFELWRGGTIEAARTAAVTVFVFGELFYLFNCRSLHSSLFQLGVFSNKWVLGGVSVMVAAQLCFVYLPLMNRFFHSAPFVWWLWLMILAAGFLIWLVVELEKRLVRS